VSKVPEGAVIPQRHPESPKPGEKFPRTLDIVLDAEHFTQLDSILSPMQAKDSISPQNSLSPRTIKVLRGWRMADFLALHLMKHMEN
jgi:hypothetical protein